MSGPSGAELLHDPATLRAADTGDLIAAASCAGAQVRAVAGQLADLPGTDRPRALVVVGPTAAADAAVLAALLGDRVPAPIVAGPSLPGWVGPLDLVVVLAGSRDDEQSAVAAGTARYRGAVVHVRAAADGPVATAAEQTLLPVELAVPEGLAAPARIALLAGLAATAGLGPDPRLAQLADLADQVTLTVHPGAESFTNPAVDLAEHLLGGVGVFVGCDPLGDALAAHAAAVLIDIAGLPAADLPSVRAAGSPALFGRMAPGEGLFDDPFADDAAGAPPARPVLLATESAQPGERSARPSLLAPLRRALPRARVWEPAPPGPSDRPVDGSLPARALALVVQLDMTAVYAGLLAGQRLPADHPNGLGRSGGSRWAVRAAVPGRRADGGVFADREDQPDRRERYDSWN